jgi:hypothetical protein
MLMDGLLGLVPEFKESNPEFWAVPFHPPWLEISFADPILGRSGEFGTHRGPQRCGYGQGFYLLIDWDRQMGCTWRVRPSAVDWCGHASG